jgi:multiple sugar transport system substrate-binding protein
MKKPILCILLAAVMCIGMAGCGPTDDGGGTDGVASPDNSTPAATDASGGTTPGSSDDNPFKVYDYDMYEAKDLGGRVITFMSHFDTMGFVDSSDPEPDISDEMYLEMLAMYQNRLRVEEKYNVRFESIIVPYLSKLDLLTTNHMAGTYLCDIIQLDPAQTLSPIVNNEIMPASQFISPNSDAINDNMFLRLVDPLLGDQYYFTPVYRDNAGNRIADHGYFLAFNRDLLNNEGIEDPIELYYNGQWTYDKFLEICMKVTKSTSGDGVIDQFGLSGWIGEIANGLIAANDGEIVNPNTLQQGLDTPRSMKALEFLQRLYVTDRVVNVFDDNVWDWTGNVNIWREGKTAFFAVRNWMLPAGFDRPLFSVGAVAFPTGPDNTTGATFFDDNGNHFAITSGTQDPRIVYQIFEELSLPYYTADTIILRELEGSSYAYIEERLSTQRDVDSLAHLTLNTGKFDLINIFNGFPLDAFGPIVSGEQTPAQAIEENKQIMQDFINNAVGIR